MGRTVGDALPVLEPRSAHLEPMEVAAYIDGVAGSDVRTRIERHLLECSHCRDEVVDASRVAAAAATPTFIRPRIWMGVAAAAVLLLVVRPEKLRERGIEHRESPVTTTVAPRALAPVGPVETVEVIRWSSVPGSDVYTVRLFDANGTVLWDGETKDTVISVPTSVSLAPGRGYFWKVEAQTGFGRRATTELVEFSIRRARGR